MVKRVSDTINYLCEPFYLMVDLNAQINTHLRAILR
jgi:hypothetical protein